MHDTPTNLPLASLVRVRSGGVRSISLESDIHRATVADGYVLTEQARTVLGRMLDRFEGPHPTRAWTLTGPYGSGKSFYGLFLMNLLAGRLPAHAEAMETLAAADASLAGQLRRAAALDRSPGLLPIPVTGHRASLEVCLRRGVADALRPYAGDAAVDRLIRQEDAAAGGGRALLSLMEETQAAAARLGFSGVVVVLDEMGKPLEHVAAHPEQADVYALQQIAEAANRSGEAPLLFIGILHQSFDRYAGRLDATTQREWSKVQGRFEDVAFQEPPAQQMWLLARALEPAEAGDAAAFAGWARQGLGRVLSSGWRPPTMSPDVLDELAVRAYPLHATTLIALPYLFRRLAQNERSLFAYLASHEPFGFRDFLSRHAAGETVRLADLFDYLAANFQGRLYASMRARLITETLERLEQAGDRLRPIERDVVKTVGLLNWLAEVSPLAAGEPELMAALVGPERPEAAVREALGRLVELSLLTHRRFSGAYAVWQGSDVDLEARLALARVQLSSAAGLAGAVGAYLPPRPIVARRHSYQTGTTRYFAAAYVDALSRDGVRPGHEAEADGASGTVLFCLPTGSHEAQAFVDWATAGPPAEDRQLVVGVATGAARPAELVYELRCLHWVADHTPELRDDPVARRELRARLAAVESLIRYEIERTLAAGGQSGGRWFHRGREVTPQAARGLSSLLSAVCDELYPDGPLLRNELLNRRALSSQAAAARRNLIEGMLQRADRPGLGIVGFPPERSMYESLLLAGGLHRPGLGDGRVLVAPPDDDPLRLRPAWAAMEAFVFEEPPRPRPVVALYEQLRRPPYGLTDGVLPVLLCGFMLAHADAATLYSEGSLLPEPGIADWEVLLRRPELFAVAGSRVDGVRAAVVGRLARGLGVAPAPLPVARDLIRRLRTLPDYAWKTQRLRPETLAFRRAIEGARSPEQLLFDALPAALGLGEMPAADAADGWMDGFFARLNAAQGELAGATLGMMAAARDELLLACGLPAGEAGWAQFRTEVAGTFRGYYNAGGCLSRR